MLTTAKKPRATTRRDGTCRTCIGPRPQSAVNERDPFCTTECCKRYYGVKIEGGTNPGIRRVRRSK